MRTPTSLDLPVPSLVLLVGPTSSGKSTFAARHFRATEVVSSDRGRAVVSDDENDQRATEAAFEILHLVVHHRLARMRLAVVDATNLRATARAPLLALARRHHLPVAAIVFDLPFDACEARRGARTDRDVAAEVLARQHAELPAALAALVKEGVRVVHRLDSPAATDAATVVRVPLPPNRRWERGPFDVVGDVHGCAEELESLLARMGYAPADASAAVPADGGTPWAHPDGRRLVFLGDLVDRGPEPVRVLRVVMGSVAAGRAFCVPGNHDDKLRRALEGRDVFQAHGLAETLAALRAAGEAFAERTRRFLTALPSHLVLDGGALVAAHGGLPERLQGRDDRTVLARALYGETTGALDANGLPVRVDWAAAYRGRALVAYGHTPVLAPRWRNETVDVDTGCVYGGALTALRWPERELVSEPARRQYAEPSRPIVADPFLPPERAPDGAPGAPSGSEAADRRRGGRGAVRKR